MNLVSYCFQCLNLFSKFPPPNALPISLLVPVFSSTSTSCLSICSEQCCVTDRLVFRQTELKNGLCLQNDELKQIAWARDMHLLYRCEVYLVLVRISQMLCKTMVDNSNIGFMSLHSFFTGLRVTDCFFSKCQSQHIWWNKLLLSLRIVIFSGKKYYFLEDSHVVLY